MAATLAESYTLTRVASFVERVAVAVANAAVAVATETPENTERSRLRRALAARIAENRDGLDYAARFALLVARNPAIVLGSSDNDIQFTVNSVWDAVAGAEPPPQP
ncbi:hypothetical protein GCM10022243_48060 [Saccharothrix violaceirubra]|uniref:2-C-methyl-D-erythritol 4-phosphate cytidylyltransferase n=1 Tax=Saccharothrix violaceirubra TaxID=413306 RepID=A0A7W7T0N4_9PSEU|nr:hypothetical protein [Saccharothrix violaceirubra]MBB4963852.1 2-C-methyl-D-erythritol 4-phosphate cytidylyltransferase [Saccharothrix violaceirubra]